MNLLKFILYSLIAFFVIRFVMRLLYPPRNDRSQNTKNHRNTQSHKGSESLEKPKFTIEAEAVDYEIIEEPNRKNEK